MARVSATSSTDPPNLYVNETYEGLGARCCRLEKQARFWRSMAILGWGTWFSAVVAEGVVWLIGA